MIDDDVQYLSDSAPVLNHGGVNPPSIHPSMGFPKVSVTCVKRGSRHLRCYTIMHRLYQYQVDTDSCSPTVQADSAGHEPYYLAPGRLISPSVHPPPTLLVVDDLQTTSRREWP